MNNFSSVHSKPAFVLLVLILLFSSCSKLPIYKSEDLNSSSENKLNQISTNNFDKSNNIHYGIANDDTNFYVKTIFHDDESVMKIMRGGFILYFDPESKKGKDYALKLERNENQQMNRSEFGSKKTSMRDMQRPNSAVILNRILTKVTWDANGKEFVFYRDMHQRSIDIKIHTNEFNELEILLRIPLSELPISASNLMSMGIETGTVSSPKSGSPNGGMRPSGGMGGGRGGGGGMSGGGGGGGRGGKGGGGGRPGGGSSGGKTSASTSPIKIWFQVEL